MDTRDKIERIIARNPELKDTIKLCVQDAKAREQLHSIVEKEIPKVIIVGKDAEKTARLFELASLVNRGFIHVTQVTTPELLDHFVDEESPSLTTIVDDLVIIRDSRAYVPNKQKSNMIMQVIEQNSDIIYYYVGMYLSFESEHSELVKYAKDNNIKMFRAEMISKPKVSLKKEEI